MGLASKMIGSLMNPLFRCSHRRLTSPVTPLSKDGKPQGDTYVVCLDCGKQFRYDLTKMRIGKPLLVSEDIGVLPSGMPRHRTSKLKVRPLYRLHRSASHLVRC
jgi:hypothetical protein